MQSSPQTFYLYILAVQTNTQSAGILGIYAHIWISWSVCLCVVWVTGSESRHSPGQFIFWPCICTFLLVIWTSLYLWHFSARTVEGRSQLHSCEIWYVGCRTDKPSRTAPKRLMPSLPVSLYWLWVSAPFRPAGEGPACLMGSYKTTAGHCLIQHLSRFLTTTGISTLSKKTMKEQLKFFFLTFIKSDIRLRQLLHTVQKRFLGVDFFQEINKERIF